MELDKLSDSVEKLLKKLDETENQVNYLRQRESNLLASNQTLQAQINEAQNKIQDIISRLKAYEEQV